MAEFQFHLPSYDGTELTTTGIVSPSGLGFWGPNGVGTSVPVAKFQDFTSVVGGSPNFTATGVFNNVKCISTGTNNTLISAHFRDQTAFYGFASIPTATGSGLISNNNPSIGTGMGLTSIPNRASSLNIRFLHTSGVKVENCKAYIYDGKSGATGQPSGVIAVLAQIIHTGTAPSTTTPLGSGQTYWNIYGGGITGKASANAIELANSPHTSGLKAKDATQSTGLRHDWFMAISAQPDSVGPKSDFALWVELEYQ